MLPKTVLEEMTTLLSFTEEIPLKGSISFEHTSKAFDSYKRLIELHSRDNDFIKKLATSFETDFNEVHKQFQSNSNQSLLDIRNMIIANLKSIIGLEGYP